MKNSNLSYWEKKSFLQPREVIIIGSGIVGLSAAVSIKEQQPTLSVLILERGILPMGASTKNAGFACFGSVSELLDDLDHQSEEQVFQLVQKRWKGLEKLRKRLGDTNIDYKEWGGYELFNTVDAEIAEECKGAIPRLNTLLKEIIGVSDVYKVDNNKIGKFGFKQIDQIILNKAEGQIDTGKMMKSLLTYAQQLGVEILTGFEVQKMEEGNDQVEIIGTNGWAIKAKKVILATNGFTHSLFPNLIVKPARNQVVITHPVPALNFEGCFHYDKGYYYFRNIGNRVLFGGGRNLAPDEEATSDFGTTELITTKLTSMLSEIILPDHDFSIDHFWSGVLGVGKDKNPIIKPVAQNIFAAVKLGGMGIAIGTLAGEEVADLVLKAH